jgi:hypothetical protein
MKVDFIDVRNWHAIKHFSHFWLGIFFVVMSVLFTLKQWEIRDYTDREEVGVRRRDRGRRSITCVDMHDMPYCCLS